MLQVLMDQASDVLLVWDAKRDVLECSEQWSRLYDGTPPFEGAVRNVRERLLVHPEDCTLVESLANAWKAGRQYAEAELRMRRPNGDYRWCRIRGCAERLAEDSVCVTAVLSDIDAQTRELHKLRTRAERDTLTGVLNRGAAEERMERALAESETHALMLVDFDEFKQVNDQWGHACGDRLLIEAAARMQQHFRAHDIVGRLGGDEFVVFLRGTAEREIARRKAQSLVDLIRAIPAGQDGGAASCSIGVARAPQDARCYAELLRCADEALYRAKRNGRNCAVLYE